MAELLRLALGAALRRRLRPVAGGKGARIGRRCGARGRGLLRAEPEGQAVRADVRVDAKVADLQLVAEVAAQAAVRRVLLVAVHRAGDGQAGQVHRVAQRAAVREALRSARLGLRLGARMRTRHAEVVAHRQALRDGLGVRRRRGAR